MKRNIIESALQKYALQDRNIDKWKLVQKTDNGGELVFSTNSSIYHAVSGYKGTIQITQKLRTYLLLLGIISLSVKRKSKAEKDAEDLQNVNKKNSLYIAQKNSTNSKLCYASNFI